MTWEAKSNVKIKEKNDSGELQLGTLWACLKVNTRRKSLREEENSQAITKK
jgi:hypothetical protein